MTRTLTKAQHAKLDKLAELTPEAVVCAWHDRHAGPILRVGKTFKAVNKDGHMKPVAKEDQP